MGSPRVGHNWATELNTDLVGEKGLRWSSARNLGALLEWKSGNFSGCIKGAKYRFALQDGTWVKDSSLDSQLVEGVRLWARLGISESLLHPFHWLEFSYVVTPIGKRGWGMTMSFRVKRRESDLGGSSQPVSTMTILFKYLFSMKPSLITLYKTAATLQLHSIFSSCFIFFPSVALTALPESVYFTSLSYSLSGM